MQLKQLPFILNQYIAISDPILEEYHDHEWCKISHDDDFQFQMLCLEGASVGLSWQIIMHKRAAYLAAFHGFIIDKCAAMTDEELEALLSYENEPKIQLKADLWLLLFYILSSACSITISACCVSFSYAATIFGTLNCRAIAAQIIPAKTITDAIFVSDFMFTFLL